MGVSLKDYGPMFGRLGPTASFDSIRSWRGTLRGWRRNLSRLLKKCTGLARLLSQNAYSLRKPPTRHARCDKQMGRYMMALLWTRRNLLKLPSRPSS
jgi:hypothetical protein